jgi:hypothetical protein
VGRTKLIGAAGAVRTAVEDDAAVGASEVRQAGRFPARSRGHGHVLVAEPALERRADVLLPAFGLEDPRAQLERRLVPDMLSMAARELSNPFALRVELEADDRALHRVRVRNGVPMLDGRPLTGARPAHTI